MSTCGVCKKSIDSEDDMVLCAGACGYAAHVQCAKKDEGEGVKTRGSKDWKCKDCRHSSSASSKSTSNTGPITKEWLSRVMEEFKNAISNELKQVKEDMEELSSSVQFMSDKLDETTTLMNEIKNEFSSIKKENEELRANNAALFSEVSELHERVRNLEQYSRINNIEISGIPKTADEDVQAIVRDVGKALGIEVIPNDIAAAHRVPSFNKTRTPSLVVQFQERCKRDNFIAKFKEGRRKAQDSKSSHLTANMVNAAFPRDLVHVNEHLSPENKKFMGMLKDKCKQLGYAFVWCRDGKFFVRKTTGEKAKKVSTFYDIEHLK